MRNLLVDKLPESLTPAVGGGIIDYESPNLDYAYNSTFENESDIYNYRIMPTQIKEAMVLWYDIKRQGCTNENMAENPVLRDLSGNGHDATCYNFTWTEESGIGTIAYPYALVSDGVDDYAQVTGLPILTDYYLLSKEEVSYEIGSETLTLFKKANNTEYSSVPLYSLLLFDRTLTSEEIEWVKANLIEDDGYAEDWYGVEFDTTVSSPDCIRIGNMDLHKSLPVHTQMKGCLLSDDGVINKYLNKTDWTSEIRDGSQGQVMVKLPVESYWRFETEGNKRRVKFSTRPLPGFSKTPQGFVSAYQATVQRSTNKLSSVVNTNADYRGGNNNVEWDGTYRSLLGMPATEISRTSFRDYARNRSADSTEWNCMTYDVQKLLYWLFVVEYATLNSQKAFNAAKTSEGYAQGGLGNGVTSLDVTKWYTFNGYYPVIPCGHTDSLGNGTGEVDYQMPEEYDTNVLTVKVPRYRGIENPFGHLWQWTDGINVRISPNEPDGDGLSKVYVCSDPSKFNDTNYDGYSYIGNEAHTEGYVKSVIFGEGGEIMPDVVGGGSTTYFCDCHYTNIPAAETLRGVRFGGAANGGANAGFVCASSNGGPSHTTTSLGSRLCFIPE